MPLLLRKARLIPRKRLLVAPRGEFSDGALVGKKVRKDLYIRFAKIARLYDDAVFHASSQWEAIDVINNWRAGQEISVATAISTPSSTIPPRSPTVSSNSRLSIVFLSRINRMKNLSLALEVVSRVRHPIDFAIFGPVSDRQYWEDCQKKIAKLPPNINVVYHGNVEHKDVVPTLSQFDVFFLPTFGENYGHVIAESLIAGTPVLISDRTPWRNLSGLGIGWDLPLESPKGFVDQIELLAQMERRDLEVIRENVRSYSQTSLTGKEAVAASRSLFMAAEPGSPQ